MTYVDSSAEKRPRLSTTSTTGTSDITSRKVASCHICSTSFRKNAIKKKCPCGSYCHKNCLGNCKISLKFFFETLYIKKIMNASDETNMSGQPLIPSPTPRF